MQDKDPLWVLLGLLILGLTLVLCGERSPKTSPPVAGQKSAPVPAYGPKVVEPSSPSVLALKRKVDELLVGNAIAFQTNSAVILPEGLAVLNSIAPILQEDPKVMVEIGGHTDNVGTAHNNQLLSERRAKAVANYLTFQGVAAYRLSARGYGASRPLADNVTVEGRAHNRRIEFSLRIKGEQP